MNIISKTVYNIVKSFIKGYLRTFMDFRVWGKENINFSGPKIYCSNHFSSTDPFFVITIMDEPVHMVVGPGFSVPLFRKILKWGEQINALPDHRKYVVKNAVECLKKGESIYIFPEGDLNDQISLRDFYTGIAKIYLAYPCPIIPVAIISPKSHVKEKKPSLKVDGQVYKTKLVLSGSYYVNIGKPVSFPLNMGEYEITKSVKEEIERLILDIKLNRVWE